MGLGLYQITTTNMKKVGGPVAYHLLVAAAGAATFLLADSAIRAIKRIRENKDTNSFQELGSINTSFADGKVNGRITLLQTQFGMALRKTFEINGTSFVTIEYFKKIK